MTGCATLTGTSDPPKPAPVVIIAPPLIHYSEAWENRLADELEAIGLPPCHPQDGQEACSALKAAVLDYAWVRDQIRASGLPAGSAGPSE